ncbi:MAG: hypothetical protein ACK5X3_22115 [Pseudomonadota bacterium]
MADDTEQQDIDTNESVQAEAEDAEALEGGADEAQAEAEAESETDAEPDEIVVTIGDDPPSTEADSEVERAPAWVRDLRKSHRELQRKVREYEERERTAPAAAQQAAPLPKKPTLEDYDYDTERYETSLESWYRQREEAEKAGRDAERKAEEERATWQAKLDAYAKARSALKARDYDDAEYEVMEILSQAQQASILDGCDDPAKVVYALGKNPKKAKELASIASLAKFNQAIGKLEEKLRFQPRNKPPAPEKTVPTGSAPISGNSDQTLERLRDEAAKTGDFTKVMRFRAQMREKAAQSR